MQQTKPDREVVREEPLVVDLTAEHTVSTPVDANRGSRTVIADDIFDHVQGRRRRTFGWLSRLMLPPLFPTTLVLFVLVPSIAAQIYLAFVASNQYEASARFAVRAAIEDSRKGDNAAGALAQGGSITSLSMLSEDAYLVVSYIRSRAIIDDLQGKIDVRAIFSRPEADFWARLNKDTPVERLEDYWLNMVSVNVDGPSGIVTIYVRAFRKEDALHLAQAIVAQSERLVNQVSERARHDAMNRAEEEVRRSDGLVRQALTDMRAWRETVGFIDPLTTATVTSKQIAVLMMEKIDLENTIFVSSRVMSADAPTITSSKLRLQSVNDQIDKLKQSLTGVGSGSLSQSLVKFEELETRRIFAEKMYSLAQDALERARIIAERQNIFIDVFVPPSIPDEARYPERLSLSIAIPIVLLVVWGIFALLVATIEDHRL